MLHPAIVASPGMGVSTAMRQLLDGANEHGNVETESQTHQALEKQPCCIMVQDQGKLLGIVTQRDLLHLALQHDNWKDLPLGQIMSHPVITLPIAEFSDAQTAQELLELHNIHHLPIVNADGCCLGVVTREGVSHLSAQSQLKASHQRYEKTVASAPVGIFRDDASGDSVMVNPRCLELCGLTSEKAWGSQWQAALHPQDRSQAVSSWSKAFAAGQSFKGEYRFLHPDGAVKWVYVQATPELDAQGQVTGYCGTLIDISDRKQAEQTLQASEAKQRAILATIPDFLFCVDSQGLYREVVNYRHGLTIFPQDLDPVGYSMHDILPAAVADQQMHYLQQALATGELQTFEQVLPLGDRIRHEEVRVIQSGADEVLFMVRDITDRKNAEQQLQNLLAGTAAETGKDFFPVLTKHLSEALGVDHALVAELGDAGCELHSLAFWSDGSLQPAIHYKPMGTLCEFVLNDGRHKCDDLAAHFSDDWPDIARKLEATSYLGIILENSEGVAIGVLWVMDRNSIQDSQRVEDIMRVFAARAAAELERQRASSSLEQLNQELENRVQERTAELQERKRFLQTVLDAFPLSVFWKDSNSVYLGCNQRFLQDAGLQFSHEVIGKTDYELVWGETDAEAYRSDDQAVMASQTAKLDIIEPLLQANGQRIWIETNKIPLRNAEGEVFGVLGTYHDITARQEAEERLRQLSDRLDLAVSSAHIGIWEFDLQEDSLLWDQQMYELYNLSPDQKSLNFEDWYGCLHPDDQEAVKEKFDSVCRNESNYDTEFRVLGPGGSIRFLKANAVAQRDKQGKLQRMIGINYDITSQKVAEINLRKMNQELTRATRLKDEFLANMSHELRTPLNAILGMTEGLKEQVFGDLNSRQIDALDIVSKSGSHLLELINDVLDLAKIEAGQVVLNHGNVSISSLAQSSIAFVKQQAAKKRIRLDIEIASDLPLLSLDGRRIRQVLVNLLANAVKFTPEKGQIRLAVSRLATPPVEDQDFQHGETLHIEVSDTGIGIAPENLCQLFDPFIQIDSSLSRQYEGTGLGLALVKCIVELHGGEVSVSSEVGVGSCFTVDLPCIIADLQPAGSISSSNVTSSMQSSTPGESFISILLAEDNEANIQTLTGYLNAKGYRVLLAKTGQQAVDLACSEKLDVVLMDIQMPGMDGLEAINQIRRLPQLAKLPIIALTALAMKGDRERCLQAGANEYFSKPVKQHQLVDKIQQLVAANQS